MQLVTPAYDGQSPHARPQQFADCYPKGRRCDHDDCTTLLSIWNPWPHCWLHVPEHRSDYFLKEAA